MRIVLLFATIIFLALPLTACKDEPQKEVHTVEWFMKPENKVVLDETLQQCKNNPGMLKDDPNCINAAAAQRKIFAHTPAPTNW